MKLKVLFPALLVVFALVLSPAFISAAAVPWSSELYTAESMGGAWDDFDIYDTVTSPPDSLPITATVSGSIPVGDYNSNSTITGTMMDIDLSMLGGVMHGSGRTEFLGTYTAAAPIFRFIYTLTENQEYHMTTDSWLIVHDNTNGTDLYNSSLPLSSGRVISVNTPAGNDISVNFGIYMYDRGVFGPSQDDFTLTYDTATVVPEPISSALFVVGGTLLAGRRFFKRRK